MMGECHLHTVFFLLVGTIQIFANDPDLLWPLDETSYTTEVQQSSSEPVDSSQCQLSFGTQPPSYQNKVIELDGTTIVDLQVTFSGLVEENDYSFSMMVRPTILNGTLFHYKATSANQFREMALYISGGFIYAKRVLSSGTEISQQNALLQLSINTWQYVAFGFDVSNGKMVIHFDGNKLEPSGFVSEVDIVVPGVLRVGGMMDQSQPNLTGRVACVAFYMNVKEPNQGDSQPFCEASSWPANTPDCTTTPVIERSNTQAGYFIRVTAVQLNTLHQISVVQKCSKLRCAAACLRHHGCWYYKFDNSLSKCTDCFLYDSSVISWQGSGPADNSLYRWKD